MPYGVRVNGKFEERVLTREFAKGFNQPIYCRIGTYDHYVMKEIERSYGMLDVNGKVVLDIGANIGAFTVWAQLHGAEKVICIEPEPCNADMLRLNSDWGNSYLYQAALTAQEVEGEEISLFISPTGKNPGNSSIHSRRGRDEIRVKALSVKKLFKMEPEIRLAKIDCEGAEYELLPVLTKYPLEQIAIEFHINGFGTEKVREAHEMLLADGWIATRPPTIQDNLWQTLAAYRRN